MFATAGSKNKPFFQKGCDVRQKASWCTHTSRFFFFRHLDAACSAFFDCRLLLLLRLLLLPLLLLLSPESVKAIRSIQLQYPHKMFIHREGKKKKIQKK